MNKLKGWKTLAVAVILFIVGGLDAMSETVELPEWVGLQFSATLMFIMRMLTSTPVGNNETTGDNK